MQFKFELWLGGGKKIVEKKFNLHCIGGEPRIY